MFACSVKDTCEAMLIEFKTFPQVQKSTAKPLCVSQPLCVSRLSESGYGNNPIWITVDNLAQAADFTRLDDPSTEASDNWSLEEARQHGWIVSNE